MIDNALFDEETILLEPREKFDDAIIGVGETFGSCLCAVYDLELLLKLLCEDGMDYEEAREYYEFNILGACVGNAMPVFFSKLG